MAPLARRSSDLLVASAATTAALASVLDDGTTGARSQAAQAGLVTLVIRDALAAFAGIDQFDTPSIQRLAVIYEAFASKYAPASAALAIRQYARQRLDAGVRDAFKPRPSIPDALAPLRVEWAISNAIGPDGIDTEQVARSLADSLGRTVQDAGRATVIDNVKRDRVATAWARIPEPELTESGTCSFCAMLCSRGAVYKEDTVGFRAHIPKNGKGHVCVCHAEPVFGKYKPSDLVKKYQDLWQTAVVDQNRHGRDARAAFRQAVEGREVTGLDNSRSQGQRRPLRDRGLTDKTSDDYLTSEQRARITRLIDEQNARIGSDPTFAAIHARNETWRAALRGN